MATVARCTIVGLINGQQTNNVLHFKADANVDVLTVDDLIAAVAECVTSVLTDALSSAWTFSGVKGVVIYPILGNEGFASPQSAVAGESTEALPTYCSATIQLTTGLGGRTNRGRIQIGGLPKAAAIGDTLNPIFLNYLIQFAACLATKFVGGSKTTSWNLCVFSRKKAATAGQTIDSACTPVKTLTVRKQLGTQNTRKVGRGI